MKLAFELKSVRAHMKSMLNTKMDFAVLFYLDIWGDYSAQREDTCLSQEPTSWCRVLYN